MCNVVERKMRARLEVCGLNPTWVIQYIYSLYTRKENRFEHRHGLQNLILTSYFYKNIYRKVIYLYFYESVFQDKFIHMVFVF